MLLVGINWQPFDGDLISDKAVSANSFESRKAAFGQKQPFTVAIQLSPEREKLPVLHFLSKACHDRHLTLSNLLRAWNGNGDTGLMQRCMEAWDTPLQSLNDLVVAIFSNQNIAICLSRYSAA